jgi:hypothetical protein
MDPTSLTRQQILNVVIAALQLWVVCALWEAARRHSNRLDGRIST